ncbi:hypothetical protein BHM03_00061390, partial [Ensete ventricosum]
SSYSFDPQHTYFAGRRASRPKYFACRSQPKSSSRKLTSLLSSELQVAGEGLPKSPGRRNDVTEDQRLPVRGGDSEGKRLAIEIYIGLPVGAPVPGHRQPPGFGSLDGHGLDRSSAGDVADENKFEVVEPVDGEPHATVFLARDPASLSDRSSVRRKQEDEECHREIKRLTSGTAPARFLRGRCRSSPRRAAPCRKVGGRDRHRYALEAPPRVRPVVADDLVALPARCAVAEQGRAQSCRPGAVPGRVQIAVPASSTYKPTT